MNKTDLVWNSANALFKWKFSVCCHPKIMLPWERDIMTSPLSILQCICQICFSKDPSSHKIFTILNANSKYCTVLKYCMYIFYPNKIVIRYLWNITFHCGRYKQVEELQEGTRHKYSAVRQIRQETYLTKQKQSCK